MEIEKINRELKKLPIECSYSFAARITLKVLPGLSATQNRIDQFGYWAVGERTMYLLSILRACVMAEGSVLSIFSSSESFIAAAKSAKASHLASSAFATPAASAAETARFAAAAVTATDAAAAALNATRTARAASFAAASALITLDIKDELYRVKKYYEQAGAAGYFNQPLWDSPDDKGYQVGEKFVNELNQIGCGFDFWAEWYQNHLDGIAADQAIIEGIVYLSEEQLSQSISEINAYLKTISQAEGALNRVRVIFVGYGESGKTSLIRALNGLEVIEGRETMTPGIDISKWAVPGSDITAHFWDFGGQVIAHATHQFFLRSQCLYILLLDGRTEINANEQAEYWLEHVRAFGGNAPVMLVGNKADLCTVNLDMVRLKEKYPNIKEFMPISCTRLRGRYKSHFQDFRSKLIDNIIGLGMHRCWFLKPHFTVLEKLISKSSRESFLKKESYQELCEQCGVEEQGELGRKWLLELLDRLGIILYFPDIDTLDTYILNPRWLTYGVYTLLYSIEAKENKKGRLKEIDVIEILGGKRMRDNLGSLLSYPSEKVGIIIRAMERFKICFRCRYESDLIIIPALLESDQPPHGFVKADSLIFEFAFVGFLPRHVMPNFIVARHDEIVDELVWQNGVVLRKLDNSAEALVQVDYHDRVLTLWVRGVQASRYFSILHDEVSRILNRMPELRFKEWVVVPESSRIEELAVGDRLEHELIRANFRQLLAMEEKGREEYDCEYGTFNLKKILQIMPPEGRSEYRNEFQRAIKSRSMERAANIEIEPAPFVLPEKPKWHLQWWFISCVIGLIAGGVAAWQLHSFDVALACCALGFGVALLFNPMRRFFRTALSVLGFVTGANTLSGLEANIDLTGLMDKPFAFMFKLGLGDKPWLNVALVALAGFLFWLDSKEDK